MKTIIMLSGVPYRSIKQRPQHMADFFVKRGYHILYLSLSEINCNLSQAYRNGHGNLIDRFFERTEEGIHILKKLEKKYEPNPKYSFSDLLHHLETYFSPKNVIFLVAHPDWVQYLDKVSRENMLIYDCLDNWESFVYELDLGYTETIIQNERKLAGMADLITVSARSLYVKMARYNNNLYYLPNGVWNEHFQNTVHPGQVPDDIRNIKRPIVFFMGGIAGWVDIDLIKYLVDARPEYSFVFVGFEIEAKLPDAPNLHFLGRKNYEELPLYLREAKVAIVPFKVNKLTAAVTPLKFYEYLSASLPVVTTFLPDLIGLPGSKMARTYEEFLKYVDEYVLMDNVQYHWEASQAVQTSKCFEWDNLLRPLCSFIEGENFTLPSKSQFLNKMIDDYQAFRDMELIQNELFALYNMTGQYQMSCSLFEKHVNQKEPRNIDYNQVALAYFKQGEIEYSISLLKKYLEISQYRMLEKYAESIIHDENRVILLELFLLKLCDLTYEALKLSDELYPAWKTNPKFLGLLSGLYMDVGEYDLAFRLSMEALDVIEGYALEEIFDYYSISFIIRELTKLKKYDIAEQIALYLMSVNRDWEDKGVKLLSEIYFMREFTR